MAALNVDNLKNGKLDLDHIAAFATSGLPTVIDRFGHPKRSLTGVLLVADNILTGVRDSARATLNGLGYLPPVPYAAGINLTISTETVQFGGVTYAPIFDALPFVTTGEFEENKFRVIQGAIKEDVTYKAVGVGAIPRPATDKLRETPSLADYDSAQDAVDENDEVFAPAGVFDISSLLLNKFGVPFRGPGALMVPVDRTDLSKGSHRYVFPEIDAHQRIFGEEYFAALHKFWLDQVGHFPATLPKIYLDGDSTVFGAYITDPNLLPHNALKFYLRQGGFDADITNKAISGAVVSQFHLSDAEIAGAACIVLSFGINNIGDIEEFVDDYRAVLAHIRSLRTYVQTTIIIKTSNACSATLDGRDETQAHAQRQALRQAAREFQCVFFDTAAFFADARNGASGMWNDTTNPPTPLVSGWVDDFHRTDPAYYDPQKFGSSVHPLELGNTWIWGRVADAILTPGLRRAASNSFFNINHSTRLASDQANAVFRRGLHVERATLANGFPIDGEVITFAAADGTGLQFNYGIDVPPTMSFRTVKLLDGEQVWGEWSPMGTQRATLAASLNGWVPFTAGQNTSVVKSGTAVTISGALKNGIFIAGTTLVMLPPGFRPPAPCWFTVPCGVNMDQMASIVALPDGVVAINNCPTNTGLSLGGITFEVA